jgi:hypothetical protein
MGALFLMGEVPLYSSSGELFPKSLVSHEGSYDLRISLQGYLTYRKTPAPRTLQ